MKVREENADLINFYVKQGTNCQKPQGISLEKKALQSFSPVFPYKKGKKFLHVYTVILFQYFPMLQNYSFKFLFGQACLINPKIF